MSPVWRSLSVWSVHRSTLNFGSCWVCKQYSALNVLCTLKYLVQRCAIWDTTMVMFLVVFSEASELFVRGLGVVCWRLELCAFHPCVSSTNHSLFNWVFHSDWFQRPQMVNCQPNLWQACTVLCDLISMLFDWFLLSLYVFAVWVAPPAPLSVHICYHPWHLRSPLYHLAQQLFIHSINSFIYFFLPFPLDCCPLLAPKIHC